MWTGTPYDRWQKRLGVTLFSSGLSAPVVAEYSGAYKLQVMYAFGAVCLAIFLAMVGLLLLKKIYFSWAKKNGHAFDNVDY